MIITRSFAGLYAIAVASLLFVLPASGQRNIGEDIVKIEFDAPPQQILPGDRTSIAPLVTGAPRIDGILDDAVWNEAAVSEGFYDPATGQKSELVTRARFCHNGDMIFIAVECMAEPGADVASDDYGHNNNIEIMIDSRHDELTYRGIIINANGEWRETSGGATGVRWQSRAQVAVARGTDRWAVEIAVPRASFEDPANVIWGFNIVRRLAGERDNGLSWNPTLGNTASPENFGHLAFETKPVFIKAATLGAFHAGISNIRVAIGNTSARNVDVRAMLGVGDIGGQMERTPFKFEIGPNETVWLEFEARAREREKCDVVFVLLRSDMETIISGFARRGIKIPPMIEIERQEAEEEGIINARFRLNTRPSNLDRVRMTFYLRSAGVTHAHIVRRGIPWIEGAVKISTAGLPNADFNLMIIAEAPNAGTQSARMNFTLGGEE